MNKRKNTPEQGREAALAQIAPEEISIEKSNEVTHKIEGTFDAHAVHQQLSYEIRVEKKQRRRKWDQWLLAMAVSGFFLSYGVIILIGFGILQFPDSTFAVPAVVAAGVLETYGLAKIAAQYFFSEDRQAED